MERFEDLINTVEDSALSKKRHFCSTDLSKLVFKYAKSIVEDSGNTTNEELKASHNQALALLESNLAHAYHAPARWQLTHAIVDLQRLELLNPSASECQNPANSVGQIESTLPLPCIGTLFFNGSQITSTFRDHLHLLDDLSFRKESCTSKDLLSSLSQIHNELELCLPQIKALAEDKIKHGNQETFDRQQFNKDWSRITDKISHQLSDSILTPTSELYEIANTFSHFHRKGKSIYHYAQLVDKHIKHKNALEIHKNCFRLLIGLKEAIEFISVNPAQRSKMYSS